MSRPKFSSQFFRALLPLALLAPACGGGGDGGGGFGSSPSVDVLLTDAPSDELFYLRADVSSLRLENASGGLTTNLLGGDVPADLTALDGLFAWLSTGDVPAGTYAAVRVGFDPATLAAADASGSLVTVNATASELRAPFAAPVSVTNGDYARFLVDIDLAATVTGDVSSGTVSFDPRGSSSSSSGDDGIAIDEIQGVVQSFDAGASTLVVDAFADGDLTAPIGLVSVQVTPSTLLVDDDGVAFASSAAFFSSLVSGATLLEVHGNLVGGAVTATKIEVEDGFGSGGDVVAKIRGIVSEHAPGTSFELMIQEIKKGNSLVSQVLQGLGNPASITIGIQPTTLFFLEESQLTTEASLAVGQKVDVKFTRFSSEPFPAFKVEIQNQQPEFEGFITDVSGLPSSFVMHLQNSEPAVQSGQVASCNTNVTVDVTGANVLLKVDDKPALSASDLLVGLKVEVRGTLSGGPTTPSIDATRVQVFEGRLDDATVSSANAGQSFFTTIGGELKDTFGGGISAGPLNVVIEPGCVFDGDAGSEAGFFALFAGLGNGEVLEVEVEGIASGQPNEIRAFVVDARVED